MSEEDKKNAASNQSKYPLGDDIPFGQKVAVACSPILMLVCVALVRYGANNILGIVVKGLDALAYYSIAVLVLNIASAISAPLAGSLGDIFGRKRVATATLIPFTVSTVLCGLATNIWIFLIAFFVFGFAYAICQSMVATMIADVVSGKARSQLLGIRHSCVQAAIMLGPIVAGFLSDGFGAQKTFLIMAPLGVLSFLAILVFMPDLRYHEGNSTIDWIGLLFLILSMGPITFLLSMGGKQIPWLSPLSFGMVAVSAVSVFLFIKAEKKAVNPLLDPSLFRYRGFAPLMINKGLFQTSATIVGNYLVLYAQLVIGLTAAQTGMFSLSRISAIVASIFVGRWLGKSKKYKLSLYLATFFALFGASLLLLVNGGTSAITIILSLCCMYFGNSFETVPCSIIPAMILPPEKRGVGLGAVWFAENVASTLSTAVYALVLNMTGGAIEGSYKYLVATFIGFILIRLLILITRLQKINFSEYGAQ